MNDFTAQRLDKLLMLLMGIMFGMIIGLLYCTWYQPEIPIDREGWHIRYVGKALQPDVQKPIQPDEEDTICECISFVDDTPDEKEIGLLCRCDLPGSDPAWVFEGSAEGLTQLYLYLDEGVKDYYNQLQEKRWPRQGLPEEPDFSEGPYERRL